MPAHRQPDACWGVLIATPAWQWWSNVVCFYVCCEQPRLFACVCPSRVDRQILLELAGRASESALAVFCDFFGPLEGHDTCEVTTGSTVTILPEGHPLPWTMSLKDMLRTHLPWHTAPAFPQWGEDDCVLLACQHRQCLFTILPHRETQYRQDIAQHAQCSPNVLQIASASPRPCDAGHQGFLCRTVVAATNIGRFSSQEWPCTCLVDARNILKGWFPVVTRDGWVDTWSLLHELSRDVARHCTLVIAEHPEHQRWCYVRLGAVLTIMCGTVAPETAEPEHIAYSPGHSAGESSPAAGQPDLPDESGQHVSGATGNSTPHFATSATGEGAQHALRGLIGYAVLGSGSACNASIAVNVDDALHDHGLSMWGRSITQHVFAEDKNALTSVVLCVVVAALAFYLFLCTCRGVPRYPGSPPLLRIACAFAVLHPCGAMQHAAEQKTGYPPAAERSTHQYQHSLRPLPTPCRSSWPTGQELPAITRAEWADIDFSAPSDVLITLLEQSVRTDDTPFFMAYTLLETLSEHLAETAGVSELTSLTQLVPSVRGATPDTMSVPNTPAAMPPVFSLSAAIGPETFDLTAHTVELPHHATQVATLATVWPPTWLAPALCTLCLPAHTTEYLARWTPWPAFIAQLPVDAAPAVHLYTDGSWQGTQLVGGYAVLIILEWQGRSTLYGILGEKTHGCDTTPWPLDGPQALRNEEVAIAAGLLWLAQCRVLCVPSEVWVHYDCYAAGMAATGEWSSTSSFAGRLRDLQRWIEIHLAVPVQYAHVKAHNGHPLNDAADALAKQVSKDKICLGSPPKVCADIVCQADLSWLATASRWQAHTIFPLTSPFTLSWSTQTNCHRTPLTAEELVPTKPVLADTRRGMHRDFALCAVSVNVQGFGGNQQYVEEQLEFHQCNLVFIQETKAASGLCHSAHFIRLGTEAKKHWGVAIWVSKSRGLLCCDGKPCHVGAADLHIVEENERLLLVTIQLGTLQVAAFSAHCPHSAKQAEALSFLSRLRLLLAPYQHSSLLVGGIDLNGRPCTNHECVTGDLAFGEADATGIAATQLFSDLGIWLPSTFCRFHLGQSATYRHPTGSEHRIDFIALGGTCIVQEASSHVLQAFDNGSEGEDHYPVQCTVAGTFTSCTGGRKLRRTKYNVDEMLSTSGKCKIAEAMRRYVPPGWDVHPDDHCKHLTTYLQKILEQHFSLPERQPRASYIPLAVWELRDAKLSLKWRSRHRKDLWAALIVRAFAQWKNELDLGVDSLVHKQGLLFQLASFAVKFATHRIKREIRGAKAAFLQGLAYAKGDAACDVLQKAKRAGIGGKQGRTPFRPLPVLMKPNGDPVCDRADRDHVWLRHFGDQEYGQIMPVHEFVQTTPELLRVDDDLQWECSHLPSQADVESVLRQLPRRKAAGLDMVPGELLRAAPGPMAAALQPLMAKSAATLQQPIQWRGGLLFEAWKRSSSQRETSAYRSLFVASTVGKVYHKVMRRKVQGAVDHELHDFHLGARKQAPVSMPALYALAHQRIGLSRNESTAILFLDTHAAYYRLVRDLAVGCIYSDSAVVRLFRHFSLDDDDLREMMSVIADGGTFADANIPGTIRHAAKDMHHFTWFVTPHTSGKWLCRTEAGSRPGESWADTVYAFIYGRVLAKISELTIGEDIAPVHCRDPGCGIFAQPGDGEPVYGQDATWADDSAWPINAACPHELLRKASRLCSIVLSHCMSHGMQPNLGRNKTALMFVLRGKGALQATRAFFRDGQASLYLRDLDIAVPTTSQYKHLGGLVDQRTTMAAEARQRLAIASQAFDKGQHLLYLNTTIPLAVRASLLQTSVTATLHNIALWLPQGASWESLCGGYARIVKRLLSKQFPGDVFFRLPAAAAYILTNCTPLAILARKARLSLLVSMCKAGPEALWAALQTEQSWFATVRCDLQWLIQGSAHEWPWLCGAAWPEWCGIMTARTEWFKKQVRIRAEAATITFCHQTACALMLWALHKKAAQDLNLQAESVECAWHCGPCGRHFKSKGALGAHFFKTHGRKAKYRSVVQGSLCLACGRQYWNTNRLARHLRDAPACAATLRSHRLFAPTAMPGFGSRNWRKAAIDDYHPAAPVQQQPGLDANPADEWDDVQKSAHLALCEVLLESELPADEENVARLVRDTVDKFPLYEDEAKDLLEFVHLEAIEVRSDLLEEGWTVEVAHCVEGAMRMLLTAPWHAEGAVSRYDAQFLTMEDVLTTVSETKWSEVWSSARTTHGTPSIVHYELDASWEAELLAGCRAIDVSAVHHRLYTVVPKVLRMTWEAILKGDLPSLKAPVSFWSHPAAAPFAPFAADNAS